MSKKILLFIIIFISFIIPVSANDAVITVVIPNSTTETTTEVPTTTAKSIVSAPKLYPVSVTENVIGGQHEIIKTYELSQYEKPADISRDNFERGGYLYELSDITKKDNIKTEQQNHTETISVDSQTKDFDAILKLLPLTKEYNSDGFTGALTLDVNSITVEQSGIRSVAYTISETREYPCLSSNDSSYIPKSIVDKYGRTLTLSNVSWRVQSSVAIDYDAIPDSYIATATYTGTAYKSVVTGYAVTAEYNGIVSKTVTGKTTYTATFIGTKIIPPTVEETTTSEIVTEPTTTTEIPTETTLTTTIEATTGIETTTEMLTVLPEVKTTKPFNPTAIIIIIIILIVGIISCYFYYKNKVKKNDDTQ
ncbi:MAG: hypothetical protein FWD71_18990 [Oscillospiraceae bacterium]|nr:hypothetical protein [Oscillospiraceae bacterium]